MIVDFLDLDEKKTRGDRDRGSDSIYSGSVRRINASAFARREYELHCCCCTRTWITGIHAREDGDRRRQLEVGMAPLDRETGTAELTNQGHPRHTNPVYRRTSQSPLTCSSNRTKRPGLASSTRVSFIEGGGGAHGG